MVLGTASLLNASTLVASGSLSIASRTANAACVSIVSAKGSVIHNAGSSLIINSGLSAVGFPFRSGQASLLSDATISADVTMTRSTKTTLRSQSGLSAPSSVDHAARSSISSTTRAHFSGGFPFFGVTSLVANNSVVAKPRRIRHPVAILQFASPTTYVPFSITVVFFTKKNEPITDITGVVEFYDGDHFIGVSNIDPSGVAALIVTQMSVGNHSLYVKYVGDYNYWPAQSYAYGHMVKGTMQVYQRVYTPSCKSNILIGGNKVCVGTPVTVP